MRPPRLLPLVLLSCGADPACDEVAGLDPALTVGTGIETFEPLTPGGTIELDRGFQGGIHLWAALRTVGLAQEDGHRSGLPVVTLRTLDGDTPIGGFTRVSTAFRDLGDGVLEAVAVQAVFDDPDRASVVGRTVTLHAEVRDLCRTAVEADVSVEVVDTDDTGF